MACLTILVRPPKVSALDASPLNPAGLGLALRLGTRPAGRSLGRPLRDAVESAAVTDYVTLLPP